MNSMIRSRMSRLIRLITLQATVLIAGWGAWQGRCIGGGIDALARSFEKQIKPFLTQHCLRCHNEGKSKSGVRVDDLNGMLEERHLKLWERIRAQLKDEAMPPEEEEQPSSEERRRVELWAQEALHVAKLRPAPKDGGVRRLTVAQYRNTLRDLLGLEEELTDVLPPDAVSRDGFLNNQETLALSPLLLEGYLEIAEKALDRSLVDASSKPAIQNFRVELGSAINAEPCADKLVLGADSLLLNSADFVVQQLTPRKPFQYEPFFMQSKFRFIEGYQGNDTVRDWKDFDGIYHAVFACMRGTHDYPKGRAYSTVSQGLLLRPAIPSSELFGLESTYGPRANFKIPVRELPDHGRFRVTVTAAKYNDGLLLDPGVEPRPLDGGDALICRAPWTTRQVVRLKEAGIYQVDVRTSGEDKRPAELTLDLGSRQFVGTLAQPAFLAVRLEPGELSVGVQMTGSNTLDQVVFTALSTDDAVARRFVGFEKRFPLLGVHLGLRRDCGSTLSPVGGPQRVDSDILKAYVFEGAIRNFPSPDVEKDNVNYLAGIREIGVRSEYTHGLDMPRLLIRSVEFEGPLYDMWPPSSHRRIFIDSSQKKDPRRYAREVIRAFAVRAFRGPVAPSEEHLLMSVFSESLDSGASFLESVKSALQVVLTSPRFLFLIENSKSPRPEPLDDHELASKLSYFLWNGPPDAITLQLASKGLLRKRLDSEVSRLIQHARFSKFIGEFAPQWLSLEKFSVLEPDRSRFPKLTRDVRHELKREPEEFLKYLIQNNLSVRHLIESDFVVVNDVVAQYYVLAGRPESGFEFVPFRHSRRELGGVFAQAAIMSGLSDGRESNPVKRGAWLARKIVAEPPDDPPPNIPTLKEEPKLTLRERLEQHRNQPGCAECHRKIDPWGVPLEQFDAGGRFKGEGGDAESILPDNTRVTGVRDLKRHLVEDRLDQVAFSVLSHLATYAIGRNLTYTEVAWLRREGLRLKDAGYRMQDLVRFVMKSPIFLEK